MSIKLRAVLAASAVLAVLAPAAWAVYGPEGGSQPVVPGGYSQTLTALTVGVDGATLRADTTNLQLALEVAPGTFAVPLQFELRRAKPSSIVATVLSGPHRHDHLRASFALTAANVYGASITRFGHRLRLVLNVGRQAALHAVVVRWNPRKQRYMRVHAVRTGTGQLVLAPSAAGAYAVLIP